MTTQLEQAARQALGALEAHADIGIKADKAITALRAALEQPTQQVREHAPCAGMNCGITRTDQVHSAECQAEHAATIAGGKFVKLEQPAQDQPVAWPIDGDRAEQIADKLCLSYETVQQVARELTHPQAREPLTDEQIDYMWRNASMKPGLTLHMVRSFARAIEAKLKEKNT